MRKTSQVITQELGVEVSFTGDQAYATFDPKTKKGLIVVPSLPENAPDDLVEAIIGYIDHESGHILETDFSFKAPFEHNDPSGPKYDPKTMTAPPAPITKTGRDGKPVTLRHFDKRVQGMTNAIEDLRMEYRHAKRYRGVGLNLEASMAWSMKRVMAKMPELPPFFKFMLAVMMRSKALQGLPHADTYAASFGPEVNELTKLVDDLIPRMHLLGSLQESYECALEVLRRLDDADEECSDGGGGGGDGPGEGKGAPGDGDPVEAKKGEGEAAADAPSVSAGDAPEEFDTKTKELLNVMAEDAKRNADTTSLHEFTVEELKAGAAAAPGHRPYTTEFDRSIEPEGDGSMGAYSALADEVRANVNVVATVFTRTLLAETRAVVRHGLHTGRLSINGMARLRAGEPNIFKKKRKGLDLDTYVEIVVDQSGSMGGHKIHVATQTCIVLAEALDRARVPFGICGFTCHVDEYGLSAAKHRRQKEAMSKLTGEFERTEPLIEYVYKRGDEPFAFAKPRLSQMETQRMSNNADGDSILRIAKRVVQRREKRKIIMVLSDGMPHAHHTTRRGYEVHSAYLKKIATAIDATPGLEVLGIGITTDAPKHFYRRAVVVNEVGDLPALAMSELRKLLQPGV